MLVCNYFHRQPLEDEEMAIIIEACDVVSCDGNSATLLFCITLIGHIKYYVIVHVPYL